MIRFRCNNGDQYVIGPRDHYGRVLDCWANGEHISTVDVSHIEPGFRVAIWRDTWETDRAIWTDYVEEVWRD